MSSQTHEPPVSYRILAITLPFFTDFQNVCTAGKKDQISNKTHIKIFTTPYVRCYIALRQCERKYLENRLKFGKLFAKT